MNSTSLVSVILSVYNSEKTIEESVKSIVNQTYKNIEILIMDDSSTDNSYTILKELAKKHKNIKLFQNKENIGLTKSLNILIEHAKGEFIARQDADDISYPERIESQVNFLIQNNLSVCISRAKIMNSSKKIPGLTFFLPNKLVIKFKNPFIHGTLVIRTKKFKEIGKYDECFYYAQDYKLFSDLIKNKVRIGKVNKLLYNLNMEDNISTNLFKEQNYYALCVKRNIKPNV